MKRDFAFAIFALTFACHSPRDPRDGQPIDQCQVIVLEVVRVEPISPEPPFVPNPARCATDGGRPPPMSPWDLRDDAKLSMERGRFGDAYQDLTRFVEESCSTDDVAAIQADLNEATSHSGEIGLLPDSSHIADFRVSPSVDVRMNEGAILGFNGLFLAAGHYLVWVGSSEKPISVDVRAGQRIVVKAHSEPGCGG